ncbi:MAG TPA: hypothetical protein VKA67_13520, partial [Verrucomicrobiae bacterium]|nr:hypothetical protein [Verrucomicrobiae bacterium]
WTASSPNDSDAKWWEFTITANSGYALDLASLTFDDRASGTGAADWSVAINGVMVVSDESTHDSFSASPMNTVTLNSYQDLTSANIKIFGYGATGGSGTWRLDNVTLNGMTVPVPASSPGFAGWCCLLGLLAVAGQFGNEAKKSRPLKAKNK